MLRASGQQAHGKFMGKRIGSHRFFVFASVALHSHQPFLCSLLADLAKQKLSLQTPSIDFTMGRRAGLELRHNSLIGAHVKTQDSLLADVLGLNYDWEISYSIICIEVYSRLELCPDHPAHHQSNEF